MQSCNRPLYVIRDSLLLILKKMTTESSTLETTLKAACGPSTAAAGVLSIGRAFMLGATLAGAAVTTYYTSSSPTRLCVATETRLWPVNVKQRIFTVIKYSCGTAAICTVSARYLSRFIDFTKPISKKAWLTFSISEVLFLSIPYSNSLSKHLVWMIHSAAIGGFLAPVWNLESSIVRRVIWQSVTYVGVLAAMAVFSPVNQFVCTQNQVSAGIILVSLGRFGLRFRSRTTAAGACFYTMGYTVGLAMLGFQFLHLAHVAIHSAKVHPANAPQPYDPINWSVGFWSTIANIVGTITELVKNGDL